MLFVIITVREEIFPESYCWAVEECTWEAIRGAAWSAEPWAQKFVRLPPAEFTYHPGAKLDASRTPCPDLVQVEVQLFNPKPMAEKQAFWTAFRAGFEARLPSLEADIFLRFAEMPDENIWFHRKAGFP